MKTIPVTRRFLAFEIGALIVICAIALIAACFSQAVAVLPIDTKAPPVTLTLKPVDVMTGITITDQSGDVTVSASFARQQIDQNGDVYSTAPLPSVSRKFTVIAKTPDVQLAVNTLADLMVAARAEDDAANGKK